MEYKTQLLVSINGGNYLELWRSMSDKVEISFSPVPKSDDYNLRIVDKNGNYVEFKCITITDDTKNTRVGVPDLENRREPGQGRD